MLDTYPYQQQNVVPGGIVGFTPALNGGFLSSKKDRRPTAGLMTEPDDLCP
jgi:hypothetical protein